MGERRSFHFLSVPSLFCPKQYYIETRPVGVTVKETLIQQLDLSSNKMSMVIDSILTDNLHSKCQFLYSLSLHRLLCNNHTQLVDFYFEILLFVLFFFFYD